MKIDPKRLFLLDGFGALASGSMLGLILPTFQGYVGMPTSTLYFLAVLAAIFSGYSLFNFLFFNEKKPVRMKLLWIANFLYCLLTTFLSLHHFASLSTIGLTYFAAEIAVILCLVLVEKRVAQGWSLPK